MKRTGVALLLIVAVVGTTWGQMDMLPQIFRDLPPELRQGLPEEMSFTALLYESVSRSGTDALTEAALEELRGFVERFPDSRFVPDSLMMIGELLAERGDRAEASSYLAVVVVAWQDHPQWAHAALRAARLYTDQRDAERAAIVLRAVIERLPGSDESATAAELLEELGRE